MNICTKFVVYELFGIMGSEHCALHLVEFRGWVSNSFETEEDAIQALITDNKLYTDYVILKKVYIG